MSDQYAPYSVRLAMVSGSVTILAVNRWQSCGVDRRMLSNVWQEWVEGTSAVKWLGVKTSRLQGPRIETSLSHHSPSFCLFMRLKVHEKVIGLSERGVSGNDAGDETGTQDVTAFLVLSPEISANVKRPRICPIAVFRCLKRRCAARDSSKEKTVFRIASRTECACFFIVHEGV